jgi:SSS family solute:Na+ symporter
MNTYGHWVVGLAVAYTAMLVVAGRVARRRAQGGAGNYFVGGRQFSPLLVARRFRPNLVPRPVNTSPA